MKTILFLPTQGPHMDRAGPSECFDWRAQCRVASALQKALPDAIIYVPSAFQQSGAKAEIDYYGEQLREEGVPTDSLKLEHCGLDTVEQCDLALALAKTENAQLLVISCYVHFKRVRYLMKGHAVEHVIAYGTPSRWLQFTHLVLGVLFPVIDFFGLRRGHQADQLSAIDHRQRVEPTLS